ncbi:MAG: helix-turn-helix domain-containing protein, partial [Limisphaerales bacterium]
FSGFVDVGRVWPVSGKPTHRKMLGQAIRTHRKKANLTQEKLGELAELNPKYIGEVERMEKTISVDALVRIAKALKVRVRDLTRDV